MHHAGWRMGAIGLEKLGEDWRSGSFARRKVSMPTRALGFRSQALILCTSSPPFNSPDHAWHATGPKVNPQHPLVRGSEVGIDVKDCCSIRPWRVMPANLSFDKTDLSNKQNVSCF